MEYFILNNWDFKNNNFMTLCSSLRDEDDKAFYYKDFTEYDMRLYFSNCILGARRYLLGEKDEDLPKARLQYDRLKILDKCVKIVFYGILFYVLFIRYDLISVSKEYLEGMKNSALNFLTIDLDSWFFLLKYLWEHSSINKFLTNSTWTFHKFILGQEQFLNISRWN